MRKVNEDPLVYQRDDGCFVCFLVHDGAGQGELDEVHGTLDYCLGYYDGISQMAPEIEAVPPAEFNSLRGSPTHECDACGETWDESELQTIKDYFQRVDPGGIVPSGECPNCGCLCYLVEAKS